MLDSKALINIGVRTPHIKRDFTNFASEGNQNATYQIERTYKDVLPQFGARYRITNDDQVFISVAKNMKAPPNFVFSNVGTNVKIVSPACAVLGSDVKEETSWNTDIGYRHQDNRFIATVHRVRRELQEPPGHRLRSGRQCQHLHQRRRRQDAGFRNRSEQHADQRLVAVRFARLPARAKSRTTCASRPTATQACCRPPARNCRTRRA